MAEASTREIVERYAAALPNDQATLRALRHPDFVEEWPQSGERIRGADNMAQIDAHYPGGLPKGSYDRIVGSEDRWVVTPVFTMLRITGSGNVFTALARATYPDGTIWHIAMFLEVRDDKIARVTTLFAPALDAPAWRAEWVEKIGTPA